MNDEVLTIGEAAVLLKVSESTIYQLSRQGGLPARKVGREWRFSKQALMVWLANKIENGQSQLSSMRDTPTD